MNTCQQPVWVFTYAEQDCECICTQQGCDQLYMQKHVGFHAKWPLEN